MRHLSARPGADVVLGRPVSLAAALGRVAAMSVLACSDPIYPFWQGRASRRDVAKLDQSLL